MSHSLRKFGRALAAAVLACTAVLADTPMNLPEGTAIPVAYVREDAEFANEHGLECGYVFSAFPNEAMQAAFAKFEPVYVEAQGKWLLGLRDGETLTEQEMAWAAEWQAAIEPYIGYHADFVVSFNEPIKAGTVVLTGYYPSYKMTMSFPVERDLAAGEEVRLLLNGTDAASVKFSYYMILNKVVNFYCGAKNTAEKSGMENWAKKMKVELRLYKPADLTEDPTDISNDSPEDDGQYISVCNYSHTFAEPDHTQINEVQVSAYGTVGMTDENGAAVTSPTPAQSKELAVVQASVAGNGAASTYVGTGVLDVPKNADGSVRDDVIASLVDAAPAALKDAITQETTYIQSYLKIRLDTVQIETKANNATAVKSLTYDVTPMVVARATTDGSTWETVETPLANALIPASGITFRLPVTQDFKTSARIVHTGDDDRVAPVQTSAGDRFVQLTAHHFSLFTLYPENTATTEVESANILGIKRTTKAATGEFVIGVPWLAYGGGNITADNLISSGLAAGDELALWNGSAYDTWTYENGAWTAAQNTDGTSVPAALDRTVARGSAGWFKRNGTGTFMQIGEYSAAAIATTVTAGTRAAQANTLLFNPKYAVFDLANVTASAGDLVTILGADGTSKTRLLYNGTSWGGYVKGQPITIGTLTIPGADVWQAATETTIPAGTGFWYISVGGAPVFNW